MRKHRRFRSLALALVLCWNASAVAFSPIRADAGGASPAVVAPRPAESLPARASGKKPATVEQLADRVRRSVVVVTFSGREGRTKGLGSGFVISDDGLIATNLHVIGEARPISVQTADGKEHEVVAVHATERSSDLAVLRIDADRDGQLQPLPLGDSSTLRPGQQLVTVGNPLGLKHGVAAGVFSGRRDIDGRPMLQLAMPIERGNSGGPVVDMQGRVHGVVSMKSLAEQNLAFAVEINALRPLLEQPNPVPMRRWLTIGRLDSREWTTVFGGRWRQRAGHIHVEGAGEGFGGRALALVNRKTPEVPFEVAVSVKLDDESGAAGLAFHSDGENRHYGFYPSGGRLRLSRFDGPDVFSWRVLQEVRSPHYRPGEWNTLKVRLEEGRIRGFVNGEPVIDVADGVYTSGKVGLAKFRDTVADFKSFRVAKSIPSDQPDPALVARISRMTEGLSLDRPPTAKLVDPLVGESNPAGRVLRERARTLERQAERLRQLARAVHEQAVRERLVAELSKPEAKIDLLRAALLVARLDNHELDVAAYVREVDRMAADVARSLKRGRESFSGDSEQRRYSAAGKRLPTPSATERAKLAALDKYLFEEMGFHGSRTEYYHRSNSYLNEVIDDREGLPIALSVLYIELARRLGVKVVGVGLPGHFVVRHEPAATASPAFPKSRASAKSRASTESAADSNGQSRDEGELIDPFDRGRRLSRKDAEERVRAITGRPPTEEDFRAVSKKAIVVRMLHNLLNLSRDARDAEGMLRYLETLVALQPESGPQRWLRAVLRYQTGRLAEARADVAWLLKQQPAEVDLRDVRRLERVLDEATQ